MARKANNPQNLKPFEKGQSGNPAGRPKKLPDLDTLLAETLSEETGGIEAMKLILAALVKKAKAGDVRAAELLMDRAYGKLRTAKDLDVTFDQLTDEMLLRICNTLIQE